jgi:hypothetical protein
VRPSWKLAHAAADGRRNGSAALSNEAGTAGDVMDK